MPPFGFSDGICVLPVWFCVGMAISRQPMPSERRLSGGTDAFCLSVWKRLGKAYVGGFVGRSGWAFCGKLRFCPLRIAAAENPVPRLETRRLAECAARVAAASSIFGWWLVFCRLCRFLGWHGGKTHGRTVQMGGQDFGSGGGLDTRADVFGIPVCGTKPFFPSDRTYRCAGLELGSVSCRRLWKHGMFGLADVFCRYGRIDRRLVLVRVLVCLFSMGSLCPVVKYNRHTLFLMRQRKIAAG